MTGFDVKHAREQAGWTQQRLAKRLRVSQGYVSMLEREKRIVPSTLEKRLLAVLRFSPLSFPLKGEGQWNDLDDETLAHQLAGLGYPGFAHLRREPKWNPAELLVAGLTRNYMDRRVAEGFPWLVMRYLNMDWDWVLQQSKLHDVQNRLGFVLTLGREVAEQRQYLEAADALRKVEQRVRGSQLSRIDTYCNEGLTQAEKRWLQDHSSAEARRWNLLSDLKPEHLSHAY